MTNILARTHLILLNGAPGAGKDTLAGLLAGALRRADPRATVVIDRMAAPLTAAIQAGHSFSDVAMATLEASKNHANVMLNGRSLREAKIAMGEQYFKPLYGRGYAGRMLLDRIRKIDAGPRGPIVVIVPDLGFEEEATPLASSPCELTVIRILRTGADFSSDSRRYVDSLGVHATIQNDGDLSALAAHVPGILEPRILPWMKTLPHFGAATC